MEKIFESGRRLVVFANGTRKEVLADGHSTVNFTNGDIKQVLSNIGSLPVMPMLIVVQIFPDGKVVYYYAETKTKHTTFSNGVEVFQFANKQVEKHFPDGSKKIQFPGKEKFE